MTPFPASGALLAPATELLTVYFPKEYTPEQQEAFSVNYAKLCQVMGDNAGDALVTASGGWCVEDEVKNPVSGEVMGKAFFGAIGWKSLQAHEDFRETSTFKENIHLLRGTEGLKGVHVEHYIGVEGKK